MFSSLQGERQSPGLLVLLGFNAEGMLGFSGIHLPNGTKGKSECVERDVRSVYSGLFGRVNDLTDHGALETGASNRCGGPTNRNRLPSQSGMGLDSGRERGS